MSSSKQAKGVEFISLMNNGSLEFIMDGKRYRSSQVMNYIVKGEVHQVTTVTGSVYVFQIADKTLCDTTLQQVSMLERAGTLTSNVKDFLVNTYSTVKNVSTTSYNVVKAMYQGAVDGYKAASK